MVCRRTTCIIMSLEERVREQGEKVRRLKAEKAPKEQVKDVKTTLTWASVVVAEKKT